MSDVDSKQKEQKPFSPLEKNEIEAADELT